ncbi:hypothetical protein B5C26_21700 [Photorhabdus luminescens]|uniref:Type 1 fimbrial protein n=1 Tax=Photorhabdus luminescens subsp. mexicana TaxID=2100167 RepID=A0A4R4J553_PHOLU|nr:type 1 fimbrial protein [Photorhabdus luminescens]OWO79187.1 hypothetical protein B5C26_21700 [Photorhabdus luminescens]TDB48713.1 type 1 fimbrial protein [Photorhabdus luminescens subsp. mexicana]
MKKILKISAVAALVLGAASAANAANNAIVNVTGTIVTATCDVTTPGSNGAVDTGNYTEKAFELAPGDKFPNTGITKYIPGSERHFTIGLANCDVDNKEASKVKLYVTGKTLGPSGYLFNQDSNGQAGIVLTYLENKVSKPIKSDSTIPMVVPPAKENEAIDANNSSAEFTVYIATKAEATIKHQRVDAPITFSYAYN